MCVFLVVERGEGKGEGREGKGEVAVIWESVLCPGTAKQRRELHSDGGGF